jgi:DNA-binding IclR family transcriptional regulator
MQGDPDDLLGQFQKALTKPGVRDLRSTLRRHGTVGAVSVAGTTEDIPLERVQNLASTLKEIATEISLRFQSGRA